MQLFLGAMGLPPDLVNSEMLRTLSTGLHLTAITSLALAIGALPRHPAGALATVLGLLLVIENLDQILWRPLLLVSPFLPGTAGSQDPDDQAETSSMSQGPVGAVLGPWQGFAALLTAAAVLLRRPNA